MSPRGDRDSDRHYSSDESDEEYDEHSRRRIAESRIPRTALDPLDNFPRRRVSDIHGKEPDEFERHDWQSRTQNRSNRAGSYQSYHGYEARGDELPGRASGSSPRRYPRRSQDSRQTEAFKVQQERFSRSSPNRPLGSDRDIRHRDKFDIHSSSPPSPAISGGSDRRSPFPDSSSQSRRPTLPPNRASYVNSTGSRRSDSDVESLAHDIRRLRNLDASNREDNDYNVGEESSEKNVKEIPASFPAETQISSSFGGPFAYKKLPFNGFRLLRLLPAKMSGIRCEVVYGNLDQPPEYKAISYNWGDSADMKKIQLEGDSFEITTSLFGALHALRHRDDSVLVWADAICINQQDREERSQQVRRMKEIYSKAKSVAIWLGEEMDDSNMAIRFLRDIQNADLQNRDIDRMIASPAARKAIPATVALFEREYWKRVWVVQEVHSARTITVHCGKTKLPWSDYERASDIFERHQITLFKNFAPGSAEKDRLISQSNFTYPDVLIDLGPHSLDTSTLHGLNEEALLEALRQFREKLALDPRDKVFAILGILPDKVRKYFEPNYKLSIKQVYTNVVDFVISTTSRLDVICDALHYPHYHKSISLPSFVPDWSHITSQRSIGEMRGRDASRSLKTGPTHADAHFVDDLRNNLEISAIPIGTIITCGVSVGTLSSMDDFLMAFLNWRAILLSHIEEKLENNPKAPYQDLEHIFCDVICLGQVPRHYASAWRDTTYNLFASLLRSQLPCLQIDEELRRYLRYAKLAINPSDRNDCLESTFRPMMMGRRFFITRNGLLGMGSGFARGYDLVVLPPGCSAPIIIRREGSNGEYRFVGDAYVNGCMDGELIDAYRSGKETLQKFVLR